MSDGPEQSPHVLRDYALIADGRRGALCGPRGEIAWLCVPRWDSDACFSSLVGGGGAYTVRPTGPFVWGGYYEPGTLVWRNRWVTTSAVVECAEALAYPGPADHAVLLRRLHALEGDVEVEVSLDVRAGFGAEPLTDLHRDEVGRWTAATGDLLVRWTGAADARVDAGRLRLRLAVRSGDHHDLVLEVGARLAADPVEPGRCWDQTRAAWDEAVPRMDATVAPRDARHAYAVMRGMTGSDGGMVAAATLGLPERSEGGRDYDYRYVWLRDQSYAGFAAAVDEPLPLFDEAVRFISARLVEDGPDTRPAYRVDGTDLPAQHSLSLPGYPGGEDVVGNWVRGQRQLDMFGEVLHLLAVAARHERLSADGERAAAVAVTAIRDHWSEPDAGIWELDDAWWTHSRLACVAGLRAFADHRDAVDGTRLTNLADGILRETSRRCLGTDGAWQRSPEHCGVDAALLLPPVRGGLPPTDPRTRATYAKVRDQLTEDGYVYRFAHGDNALGEAEGAFLLCGFTTAMAAWQQGDAVAAFRWFERNRAACGPSGLLAEEYDVQQRQLRGNLPQAFVHAALLEAAHRLAGRPPAVEGSA